MDEFHMKETRRDIEIKQYHGDIHALDKNNESLRLINEKLR
jgi:hypothetical protein